MAKKFKVQYLPLAESDLIEIFDYITADNPTAALSLLDQIDESISQLEDFPLKGDIPNDSRLKALNYRMLVIGSYLVFYTVFDNIVEIRRLLHSRRKYQFLL